MSTTTPFVSDLWVNGALRDEVQRYVETPPRTTESWLAWREVVALDEVPEEMSTRDAEEAAFKFGLCLHPERIACLRARTSLS